MSFEVSQLEAFEFVVHGAVDHYSVEAPHMLDAFLGELDATVARIVAFPTAPRIIRGSTRAVHMRAGFLTACCTWPTSTSNRST